jgi:cyanate permease
MFLLPLLSYRMGRRKPFLWGSGLLLALTALWAIYVNVYWGWVLMSVVGIVVSGSFSMILALPAELSRGRSIGSASGMMFSIGYIGGLIAPWLAGYLFDISGTLDWSFVALRSSSGTVGRGTNAFLGADPQLERRRGVLADSLAMKQIPSAFSRCSCATS